MKRMKRWYAGINGDDKASQKNIKIGIVKTKDPDEAESPYAIIADNGDDCCISRQRSLDEALEAIEASWGRWETFRWL